MVRPSFSVTASLVVCLAAIGLFKYVAAPRLPKSTIDIPATRTSETALPAAVVEIAWRPRLTDALAESKQKKRPILLFFVDPISQSARDLEDGPLRNVEVARQIYSNFIPCRINLADNPEWETFLFPLNRTYAYFDASSQLLVSDHTGTLISTLVPRGAWQYSGYERVLEFLRSSAKRYSAGDDAPLKEPLADAVQAVEIQKIVQFSLPRPADLKPLIPRFVKELSAEYGGSVSSGYFKIRPLAIRFFGQIGSSVLAESSATDMLLSPLYDVVDGGFFVQGNITDRARIETGKSIQQTALAAEVLAEIGAKSGDSRYMGAAKDCADSIIRIADPSSPGIPYGLMLDQSADGRSARYSLTQRKLLRFLNPTDIDWIEDNLAPNQSAQQLGSLSNINQFASAKFSWIRESLRKNLPGSLPAGRSDRTEVCGYVGARLMRVALLTNDLNLRQFAAELISQSMSSYSGGTVSRFLGGTDKGWLGSFLGVADAALAEYLADGRVSSLELGAEVLGKALDNFMLNGLPMLVSHNAGEEHQTAGTLLTPVPNFVDSDRESTAAIAIRLCWSYSNLVGEEKLRNRFRLFARDSAESLSSLLSASSIQTAGLFSAVDFWQRGTILAVKTASAETDTAKVSALYPYELAAPSVIGTHLDKLLQGKPFGVYRIVNGVVVSKINVSVP